jgi:hypothetical protein
MDNIILWGGLVLLVALLTYLNQKQVYSSKVKRAYRELRGLAEKAGSDQSSPDDLGRWESALTELEKHPNEFNKLDYELGLRGTFAAYLERHYPQDGRLPALQEAAAHRKDNVWGIKIGDYSSKK